MQESKECAPLPMLPASVTSDASSVRNVLKGAKGARSLERAGSEVISATHPSLPRWIWACALRTDLKSRRRSAEARFHRDKLEGGKECKGNGTVSS